VLHGLWVGGAEVLAARLARQLRDSYRFVFLCLDELGTLGAELRSEGFPVEVVGRRPGVDWRCSRRLAQLINRYHVDLLQAHQYTPFFYSLTARLLGGWRPVLFVEHGRHFPDYPRRKRMVLNRLLLSARDRVVGVGNAVRQALIAHEGFPARRVRVIYNGIDAAAFAEGERDRSAIREGLGIGGEDLLIIQVARLDYLKDHLTAVRSLERVVCQRPSAHLVLVGEGPEQEKIEKAVSDRGLNSQVHFVGLRKDVPRLLAAADLFLLTSISEGIPLTVIEAMLSGLPVIATRVGGLDELVVHEQTGWLVAAGDDAALAEAILRVALNPRLGAEWGRCGRQRARTLFSEERMHTHYASLYQEMLGG
jgi:glycosyltransferase involved in cell wall biosynthesis